MHRTSRVNAFAGTARAVLIGCCLAAAGPIAAVAAGTWSEFGIETGEPTEPVVGREVREPFFAFLLDMSAVDSVGHWTGVQVQQYALEVGQESRFPLPDLVSVSRSRPAAGDVLRYPGARLQAVWRIVLTSAQDRPMPYSILGYHPGSLRIAQELVLGELAAMELRLEYVAEGENSSEVVHEVRIFALEKGYILLDADGWLDALLGAALDDAWTLGFVIAREKGRLLGLGVSLGRKGRRIYGEFDFASDEVLAHGRPLASALSRASRRWLAVEGGNLPVPWSKP